jgi:pyrroloquinoline quinone biosynthesis protein D
MSDLQSLTETSVPSLPRGVRFRFDEARQAWVLLAPERVVMPDEIAVEVLKLVDGASTIDQIVDKLAQAFAAPREQILPDVLAMFNDLAAKGLVRG